MERREIQKQARHQRKLLKRRRENHEENPHLFHSVPKMPLMQTNSSSSQIDINNSNSSNSSQSQSHETFNDDNIGDINGSMFNIEENIHLPDQTDVEFPIDPSNDNMYNDNIDNDNIDNDNIDCTMHSTNSQLNNIDELENYLVLFLNQIRHNFTNEAVVDNALGGNFISADTYCLSYKTMCKRANVYRPQTSKYFYSNCGLIGPVDPTKVNNTFFCKNECKCEIRPIEKMQNRESYFCYIELKDYLQYLIPRIFGYLRFDKHREDSDLCDITDGSDYRKLAGKDTLVLYFGFDGVSYVKSGRKSMWPLVIYICELPFDLRMKFAFPIAIHSGSSQPSCVILEPFIDELYKYMNEPICFEIQTANGPVIKQFYLKLLLGICDAPARAKVVNMLQHNGKSACNMCKVTAVYNKDISCMVFPLERTFDSRTNSEWRSTALEAEKLNANRNKKDRNIDGIKGTTPLMKLPYINMPSILPPEFMHSQFLGTVKLLVDNWLGSRAKDKLEKLDLINTRLCLIKFPTKILRQMSELTTKMKSIELENVLYYGIVAFEGLLPEKELETFKILSFVIATLSDRKISLGQIRLCEELIRDFILNYIELYDNEMCKYNIHMLTHLPEVVRRYGPLITNSAYQVENSMGQIAKNVKSPNKVSEQVLNKSVMCSSIITNFTSNYDNHTAKFKKFLSKHHPYLERHNENIPSKFTDNYKLSVSEVFLLNTHLNNIQLESTNVQKVEKITIRNYFICSNNYSNNHNMHTNNQYIKTKSGKYYVIENIIKLNETIYLFCYEYLNLKKYKVNDNNDFNHIKYALPQDLSEHLQLILLSEIDCPFSVLFLNSKFILFDLFNRHI